MNTEEYCLKEHTTIEEKRKEKYHNWIDSLKMLSVGLFLIITILGYQVGPTIFPLNKFGCWLGLFIGCFVGMSVLVVLMNLAYISENVMEIADMLRSAQKSK